MLNRDLLLDFVFEGLDWLYIAIHTYDDTLSPKGSNTLEKMTKSNAVSTIFLTNCYIFRNFQTGP